MRVLVVDDVPDSTESMALLLRLWGHEAQTADDGLSALAVAADFRPDVALVDVGMPGMDGYEFAGRVRSMPGVGRVLLVALTGYGGAENRRRVLEAGFDVHLVKPADLDQLENLLAGYAAAPPQAMVLLGDSATTPAVSQEEADPAALPRLPN
jgi:CheY-like chemotaxis protein